MRILLFIILVCYCFDVNSQSIVSYKKATENWANLFVFEDGRYVHRNKNNNSKDEYIIIPFEGQSQAELFKKMMLALNDVYVDIDKVTTKIEHEAITVNGQVTSPYPEYDSFTIWIDEKCYQSNCVNYRFTFKFKDGKLRIDAPINTTMNYYPFEKKHLSKIVPFETFIEVSNFCQIVGSVVGKQLLTILKKMSTSNDDW